MVNLCKFRKNNNVVHKFVDFLHRFIYNKNSIHMLEKLIPIKTAAQKLGVSIDTLRRWDKNGKLSAVRKKERGNLYYREIDIELYSSDVFSIGKNWTHSQKKVAPEEKFYCPNGAVFQTRLIKMQKRLAEIKHLHNTFPLIVAICGEIGNNSFDHNLGNWPGVVGVFFGYDLNKRYAVLADRGRGILETLKRVKPELKDHQNALRVAFSEIISGRAPEARGNGLKFVRREIIKQDFYLFFQSGDAELELTKEKSNLKIEKSLKKINGCLALIKF